MKNLKIASLVIALPLFIGQLSFAQDSSSDINIAIDGSREILEKQLDVPLSVPSAYQMGFERATGVPASIPSAVSNFIENVGGAAGLSEATIDAITGPVGAFLAASGESSTAGPDLDEVDPNYVPGANDENATQNFLQQLQAQQDAQSQFDELYMRSLHNQLSKAATAPSGPSISPNYNHVFGQSTK